jgi:hypothetical protein
LSYQNASGYAIYKYNRLGQMAEEEKAGGKKQKVVFFAVVGLFDQQQFWK